MTHQPPSPPEAGQAADPYSHSSPLSGATPALPVVPAKALGFISGEGHSGPCNLTLQHRYGQRPSLNCLYNKDFCSKLQKEKMWLTYTHTHTHTQGNYWSLPGKGGAFLVAQTVKESACNAGDQSSMPGSGKSPGEGNGTPLQYPCLEKSHGWRSLLGYSPWGLKEWDTIE